MMRPSSFNGSLLLYAGCCAVAAFVGWPYIKDHFGPDMTPYTESGPYRHARQMRAPGMRLDPDVPPGQIEDRRGEHGDMGRDLGGSDIGRISPPPQAQWPRPPYTDGRDVQRRADEADSAPPRGRHQVKVCTSPWWSAGPLQCGPWQEGR